MRTTRLTSEAFEKGLLQHAKVAVVPGNVFGEAGQGFIRCSYATSVANIERALHPIRDYVRTIG
jgi:aminotransferase